MDTENYSSLCPCYTIVLMLNHFENKQPKRLYSKLRKHSSHYAEKVFYFRFLFDFYKRLVIEKVLEQRCVNTYEEKVKHDSECSKYVKSNKIKCLEIMSRTHLLACTSVKRYYFL